MGLLKVLFPILGIVAATAISTQTVRGQALYQASEYQEAAAGAQAIMLRAERGEITGESARAALAQEMRRLITAKPSAAATIRAAFEHKTGKGDWDLAEFERSSRADQEQSQKRFDRILGDSGPTQQGALSTPPQPSRPIASPSNIPPSESVIQPPIAKTSSGTAFFVTGNLLITNYHVIDGCGRIQLPAPYSKATLLAIDRDADLALLSSAHESSVFANVREETPRPGETILVAGYPYAGLLGQSISVTVGNVSSAKPLEKQHWVFTHTAPIQPGNSGGPIFDKRGMVIGAVQGKLDDLAIAKATGSMPQNVNFGVSSSALIAFLKKNNSYRPSRELRQNMEGDSLAAMAAKFTVLVLCYTK